MRRNGPELEPEDLLQHGGFLRRLARGLVQDEHEREDLVQHAWTAALSAAAPREPASLRAWLARALRNRASNARRDAARRRWLEAELGRDMAHESELEDQLELQARVVEAVRGLREPYRRTIWLRYFGDLGPKAIAEREGVPLATVDARLARGRALLRERLSAERGDRRAWLALLAPLSERTSSTAGTLTGAGQALGHWGGWIVSTKLKLGIALGLSVAALGAWQWRSPGLPAEPQAAPPGLAEPAVLAEASREAAGTAPVADLGPREPVARDAAAQDAHETPVTAAAPAGMRVAGRALDVDGYPLRAKRVRYRPSTDTPGGREVRATTDADGRFTLEGVPGAGRVELDEEDWVTVLYAAVRGDGYVNAPVVVGASWVALDLEVVAPDGTPVSGARVSIAPPDDLRRWLGPELAQSATVSYEATSDEEGAAHLPRVPRIADSVVRAEREGFASQRRVVAQADLGTGPRLRLTLVLEPLEARADVLEGQVVDEFGDGVPDAGVAYRLMTTHTDATGRFFFDLAEERGLGHWWGEPGAEFDLVAVREGYLPATLRPALDPDGRPRWPEWVVLQVAERPLSIRGHVVDQEGGPLAGMRVFLRKAHLFGGRTLEGTVAGDASGFLHAVTTDDEGAFELGGLLDQDYDVAAIDPDTLLCAELEGVAAGERDARFTIDTRRVWRRVRGRVVDHAGAPVAGVVLYPYATTQTATGAQGYWMTAEEGPSVTSGDDGRFTLRDVPREHVELAAEHPDILHQNSIELPAGSPDADTIDDLEVVATLRLSFQVILQNPAEADEIRILDADGAELDLYIQTANMYAVSDSNPILEEGRSEQLFVAETARTLVLRRNGAEVRRLPIELRPRERNVLRP